jgi:two-component system nitrate/nitrite response regulator NarL
MKSIRVLIVDDLPQVRQGLASMLHLAARRTKSKIEVTGEAQNGMEAIQQARALDPDVILMDLEMPILDGYEATRQIKVESPRRRVIILSIHSGAKEQMRAREAGADGFVAKGARYQELINAILGKDGPDNLFKKGEKS